MNLGIGYEVRDKRTWLSHTWNVTSMSVRPRSQRRRASVLGQRPPIWRADGSPIRVLLVDDERALTHLVTMALSNEGWLVDAAHNGRHATKAFASAKPDIVVLDIMLPDLNGLQILEQIRAAATYTPVLFLTARDSVLDRVTGLTAGADDYMTKPFSLEELVARMRGLLRRGGETVAADRGVLSVGDLVLDDGGRNVIRGSKQIILTPTEFELLRYMMRNSGRPLLRDEILQRVWKYSFSGKTGIVDLYISYLRKKIDAGREPIIHTIRGIGYQLGPTR